MGQDAHGVTIQGLQYGLENGTLRSNLPLGVSNHFTGQQASIRVDNGTLLVVYDVRNLMATGEEA